MRIIYFLKILKSSKTAHGHAMMFVHTVRGSRFLLTRSSMICGKLFSNVALHSAWRVSEPITMPMVWQISLKNCTIWSSVVVSVMKLSMSVMTSTQMVQVSSFLVLGAARAEAARAEMRRANFILNFLVGCLLGCSGFSGCLRSPHV